MDLPSVSLPADAGLDAPSMPLAPSKNATDAQLRQSAQDFESVFINQLLDEMKSTVDESGLLSDETSDQVNSIYTMYMSQGLAKSGGIGLATQLYKQFKALQAKENAPAAPAPKARPPKPLAPFPPIPSRVPALTPGAQDGQGPS